MAKTLKILLIVVVAILVLVVIIFIISRHLNKSSSTTAIPATTKSLFGTMLAFNINNGLSNFTNTLQQEGWTKFSADTGQYQQFKTSLETSYRGGVSLAKQTGFPIDREIGALFTWNVIEPQKGTFNWELTDLAAKYASQAGEKFSAVIQPYAAWDQQNTQPVSGCQALDFSYYDFKAGPINDTAEYENFLTKMVERYKGNVAVWEIGNEPDASCSGFQNNPQAYFNLLKVSYETIKKADPSAIIVNGGASGFANTNGSEKSFWTTVFQAGGDQYIDYFNLHYNVERSQDAKLDPTAFEEDLQIYNGLMETNGGKKPLYITEFGIYSGTPSQPPATKVPVGSNQVQNTLPNESSDAQAALYFKDLTIALESGAKTIFIDLNGNDNNLIGSSAIYNLQGQARTFWLTLKMLNQKLSGFSKSGKIADGQYKFTVGGKTVYALWSGTLPSEISGKVKVTDIKGQVQTLDETSIKLSSDQPVLVELND